MCVTALAVGKFIVYESSPALEYEVFTRTEISAITEFSKPCTDIANDLSHVLRGIQFLVHPCHSPIRFTLR